MNNTVVAFTTEENRDGERSRRGRKRKPKQNVIKKRQSKPPPGNEVSFE